MSAAQGVAERLLALERAVAELQEQVRARLGVLGAEAAAAQRSPSGSAGPAHPDGAAGGEQALGESAGRSGVERLALLLGNARLAAVLARAGYGSPETAAAAPDEALLAIDGIGDKALKLIREQVTP